MLSQNLAQQLSLQRVRVDLQLLAELDQQLRRVRDVGAHRCNANGFTRLLAIDVLQQPMSSATPLPPKHIRQVTKHAEPVTHIGYSEYSSEAEA